MLVALLVETETELQQSDQPECLLNLKGGTST